MEKRRRFMVTVDAGDYLFGFIIVVAFACILLFFATRWLLVPFLGHSGTADSISVAVVITAVILFIWRDYHARA